MAKKAASAASKGGMGGMVNKLLAPLYKKIPIVAGVNFRPMIQTAVGKLLSGDVNGAKKAMINGLKKAVMSKALEFMKPYLAKIPAKYRPMVESTLSLVLRGDIKGAIASLKGHIVTIGVQQLEGLVSKMTNMLPVAAIRNPARKFLMDTIKKIAKSVTGTREIGQAMGEDVAVHEATDEEVASVVNSVIQLGAKLVQDAAPGLIDDLTAKAPQPVRTPLNHQLKALFKDVMTVLADQTKWNPSGMSIIVGYLIKHVKELAQKLAGKEEAQRELTFADRELRLADASLVDLSRS